MMSEKMRLTIFVLVLSMYCWHSIFASEQWQGLSYDSSNFLCEQYPLFCENFLDEMGCGTDEASRTNIGCIDGTLYTFKGQCSCHAPTFFDFSSTRISHELIVNRIAPEMSWMLEPFATGPPYDMGITYSVKAYFPAFPFVGPL